VKRGFTIIELVVCVMITAVVISLFVSVASRVRKQSALTRDVSQIRQLSVVVAQYTNDFQDAYPFWHKSHFYNTQEWYKPMLRSGYFPDIASIDSFAVKHNERVRFMQSKCTSVDPKFMVLGSTVPPDMLEGRAMKTVHVRYQSQKGHLVRMFNSYRPGSSPYFSGGDFFCCSNEDDSPAPIAAADGSTRVNAVVELIGGNPLIFVDGIGIPVLSSWNGIVAQDWR
jgi:prepilin-type N-terminal cleavage/methylation domain-containing protein